MQSRNSLHFPFAVENENRLPLTLGVLKLCDDNNIFQANMKWRRLSPSFPLLSVKIWVAELFLMHKFKAVNFFSVPEGFQYW